MQQTMEVSWFPVSQKLERARLKHCMVSASNILEQLFFSRVLPSNLINIEALKQDVWSDLSAVYYKYEDDYQKRAFREIIFEISERLNEDKWNNVYKKLHITNQRKSMLHRLV